MVTNAKNRTLLEVIFERLDGAVALNLAAALSIENAHLPNSNNGVWESMIECLEIETGVLIKNAHVRILCYEDSVYDVELNFVQEDTITKSIKLLQSSLHRFSLDLASKHSVHSCYGGLEPAVDEETRLFTNEKLGPILLGGERAEQ